jgi:hypothetical protein
MKDKKGEKNMNANNKKAMSLLVVLGFFISVLAVFGPVGAETGRAPVFTVAATYYQDGLQTSKFDLNVGNTLTVNLTVGNTGSNSTDANVTLFYADDLWGVESVTTWGPMAINNTTPIVVSYDFIHSLLLPNLNNTFWVNVTDANASVNVSIPLTIGLSQPRVDLVKVTSNNANNTVCVLGVNEVSIDTTIRVTGSQALTNAQLFCYLDNAAGAFIGQMDIPTMQLGATATHTYKANFSGMSVSYAEHAIYVEASCGEITFANTSANFTVVQAKADIQMLEVTATPDTFILGKGQTKEVTIEAHVINLGTIAQSNVTVNFYLDSANTPTGTVTLEESLAAATGEKYVDYYYNFTDAQIGTHVFWADVPRFIGSTDITQNVTPNITITGEANVSVDTFTLSAASGLEGDTVTMTAKLFNNGTADAVNYTCEFVHGTSSLGTKTNLTVVKGGTLEVVFSYTLPNITVDNMTQGAAAKVGNSMKGTNLTIIKKKPVVVVANIAIVPAGFKAGDTVTATVTVNNSGTAVATGVVIDLYDGNTKIGNSTAMNISAGSSQAFTITAIVPASTTDANHTFYAKYGTTAEKNMTVPNVPHTPTVASIVLGNFTVSPKTKDKMPKDSTQSYTLTVVLKNNGELAGTVVLTVKEGTKTINTQNVTVAGKGTQTVTIVWKVKGDGSHSAVATITGAGTGTATAKATLKYTPGFEVIFLAAAILVAAVLVRRRKQ